MRKMKKIKTEQLSIFDTMNEKPEKEKMTPREKFMEWGAFLAMVIFLAGGRFYFNTIEVSGESMMPTYENGDKLFAYKSKDVSFGDVVVVDSVALDEYIIKRVIGVPGDHVQVSEAGVFINDEKLEEDYINENMLVADAIDITLTEGRYFVMGDNRNHSADSRVIGSVADAEVLYEIGFELPINW